MDIIHITGWLLEPVMEGKPVNPYITILRLLLPNQLSVNQLYKQTGLSYKPRVIHLIKDLEKGKLVRRTKDNNHAQREYIQLTEIGHEFAQIIVDIENYKGSYLDMDKQFQKLYDPDPSLSSKTIKRILRNKGLGNLEIENYDDSLSGISGMLFTLEEKIINAIIFRFTFQLLKKYSPLSKIAIELMNIIFEDIANFRLKVVLAYYKDCNEKSNKGISLDFYEDELLNSIENFAFHPFFGEVLNQLISAYTNYLMLARPDPAIIKSRIEERMPRIDPKGETGEISNELTLKMIAIFSKVQIEGYKGYLTKINAY